MNVFRGKSTCDGIAMGRLFFFTKKNNLTNKSKITDSDAEYSRFKKALEKTIEQLDSLKQKAVKDVGEENAEIFEIHKLMLYDEDYIDSVKSIILEDKYNAEYAVTVTCEKFADIFSSMSDNYMTARAVDVKDISQRIILNLNSGSEVIQQVKEPVIIVADDLTPSETLQFDRTKIVAFITAKGSVNSHASILARAMNVPAVIGVDLVQFSEFNGKLSIVDGENGIVYVEPDEEILKECHNKLDARNENTSILQNLIGKDNITLDGKKIELFANIGNIKDISKVIENDATGIGLFRSEFIFLEKNTFPSEEEQFAIYKNAIETMDGKKVIIRTLDIGADKKVDYFKLNPEENPALGLRAIRLCLKMSDVFKTQLRALLRASVYGNLSIMYPMIISVNEVRQIKKILLQTARELEVQGIPYRIPEQGIMIETPASVMISDDLAKEVSFFSIGTNDLSQYVMAIDRQNPELDEFFDPYHPSVIKMIEITVKNAHKNGIWVGICGELAADLNVTEKLLKIGIDELSVSPGRILGVRKKIREINISNKK